MNRPLAAVFSLIVLGGCSQALDAFDAPMLHPTHYSCGWINSEVRRITETIVQDGRYAALDSQDENTVHVWGDVFAKSSAAIKTSGPVQDEALQAYSIEVKRQHVDDLVNAAMRKRPACIIQYHPVPETKSASPIRRGSGPT